MRARGVSYRIPEPPPGWRRTVLLRRTWNRPLAAAALALAWPGVCLRAAAAEASPPRLHRGPIVLITIDALRADTVGALGGPPKVMPRSHGLAREATWAGRAVSPSSWTVPSMAALFTGFQPWRAGSWASDRRGARRPVRHPARGLEEGGLPHRRLPLQPLAAGRVRLLPGVRHLPLPARGQAGRAVPGGPQRRRRSSSGSTSCRPTLPTSAATRSSTGSTRSRPTCRSRSVPSTSSRTTTRR